ncbi:hypothetical protein LOK46_24300 [Methylobacterium sp. NMS14P]|uniref:DUF6894 family protein n=1 Tax=unclassified Methylobacterium TaxID=2615210 RepID=UPI00235A023E|nr:hypothetical protein [Methylobacterium sp. NMS14P]WCS24230.1 hypothetical protein LOK46_24300 [Methylobacterium sp. NMS14P]
MPRFYFHIRDGRDQFDTDGTELPDEETAHVAAIRLTGAVLQDEARRIATIDCWTMDVTDATGRPVYQVGVNVSDRRVSTRGNESERR